MMAVTRLSGGLSPADGSDPRTFPLIFNEAADVIDANETDITAVEGRVTTAEADITELETVGFRFVGTRYYTSDGTFAKADPFGDSSFDGAKLRAIRVRMAGGGGGGAGVQAAEASQCGGGPGGSAGGFAESFITDIDGLAASVGVTRGSGGSGGSGTSSGSDGGASSGFGLSAGGGLGGTFTPVGAVDFRAREGLAGGIGSGGQINIRGGGNGHGGRFPFSGGGSGGNSVFGGGGPPGGSASQNESGVGQPGGAPGAGGGGAFATQGDGSSEARTGGAGADGIIIIDIFA